MQAATIKQPLGLAAPVELPRTFLPFAFDFERDFSLPPDVVVYDSPVPGIPKVLVRRPLLFSVNLAPFPPKLTPKDFLFKLSRVCLPSFMLLRNLNPITKFLLKADICKQFMKSFTMY